MSIFCIFSAANRAILCAFHDLVEANRISPDRVDPIEFV